ncbi:MAG: hypothetical protein QOI42_1982 [Frankiaceae bacterium]|jgi:hypothetical protein|nr:hypothetical protein [Frankiaceae bacterium]
MSRLTTGGRAAVAAVAIAGLAACSSRSATSTVAVFRLPDAFQPDNAQASCLLHQTDAPTTAYEGGTSAALTLQLPFMAYYKANGTKAFCDGKTATDLDRKWAAVYVRLTSSPADVKGVTG